MYSCGMAVPCTNKKNKPIRAQHTITLSAAATGVHFSQVSLSLSHRYPTAAAFSGQRIYLASVHTSRWAKTAA